MENNAKEKNSLNGQIIVVQNEESNQEKKWTWGKYGHFIYKFKYWVLGFTLLGAIAGFLGTKFGYNAIKEYATVTFKPVFPTLTSEDGNVVKKTYFDGSDASLLGLTNKDKLEKVKASSPSFSSLNISKILEDGDISIAEVTNENDKLDATPTFYTIKAKVSSFGGERTSKQFLFALIDNEKASAENALNSYSIGSSLNSSFSSLYLPTRTKELLEQYKLISSTYDYLLTNFGRSYYVNDDFLTLDSARSTFLSSHNNKGVLDVSSLQLNLERNSYVYFEEGKQEETILDLKQKGENYIELVKSTIAEINNVSDELKSLTSTQSYLTGESVLADRIIELSNQKTSLNNSLSDLLKELKYLGYVSNSSIDITDIATKEQASNIALGSYLDTKGAIQQLENYDEAYGNACSSFIASLENMKSRLEEETKKVDSYLKNLYLRYNDNYYVQNGSALLSGGINSFLGAFMGLLLFFLATSLIVTGVGINKNESTSKKKIGSKKVDKQTIMDSKRNENE
ncbi:MAG TPA: hypothetical protein DD377_03585 [Firmicutes bacterium]|nr:hypothetical protein [Bacillota bacterium]